MRAAGVLHRSAALAYREAEADCAVGVLVAEALGTIERLTQLDTDDQPWRWIE